MEKIFVPHGLKTVEIDAEKRIFKVNGEDFGKGCTSFRIICNEYESFDIYMDIDTTVHYSRNRGGKQTESGSYVPHNTVTVDIVCPGIDEAVSKATELKEKIMEARTLAGELTSILGKLDVEVEECGR